MKRLRLFRIMMDIFEDLSVAQIPGGEYNDGSI